MLSISLCGAVASAESPHPIDARHHWISQRVLQVNRSINRLIEGKRDDEPLEEEVPLADDRDLRGSHMRVSPWVLMTEGGGHNIGVDYGIRLRLRGLSDRLDFFADRYDRDRETLDISESDRYRQDPEPSRNDPALAGLTYFLLHDVARQLSLSGGVRFRPEPRPRVRLRGRYRHAMGEGWTAFLEQSVYWDHVHGFGERTQLEFSRPAGDNVLFRMTSSLVWSEQSRGLDWGHVTACSLPIGTASRLELRGGALGYTHPGVTVDQYLVRATYRQQFQREWLVLQVEPGVDWFHERDYASTLLVSVKLEIRFGASDAYRL